jgi:hypothetical protein
MHQVGSKFARDAGRSRARPTALLKTTRAMISDPKLPFAPDSTRVGEIQSTEASLPVARGSVSTSRPASAARLWLHRVGVLLFVFLCATLGVMLMILPWRPEWSDNPLLLSYPALRAIMASGFARGLATGLGVLNVWIGFWEAIQYREEE